MGHDADSIDEFVCPDIGILVPRLIIDVVVAKTALQRNALVDCRDGAGREV